MYVDGAMNYTVIERTSNEAFQALWLNCNWRSKEISAVVLFIGNIILRKVFFRLF